MSIITYLRLNIHQNGPEILGIKMPIMTIFFGSFDAKSLSNGRKFVHNIYRNPNCPHTNKLFFPNFYKLHNLCILMDFYLAMSRGVFQGLLDPMDVV
jgi:hypothetical protein